MVFLCRLWDRNIILCPTVAELFAFGDFLRVAIFLFFAVVVLREFVVALAAAFFSTAASFLLMLDASGLLWLAGAGQEPGNVNLFFLFFTIFHLMNLLTTWHIVVVDDEIQAIYQVGFKYLQRVTSPSLGGPRPWTFQLRRTWTFQVGPRPLHPQRFSEPTAPPSSSSW